MINPMQIMGMMNQLRGNDKPLGMLQGMYGNNPNYAQVMQMVQGKSPQQMQQMVMQLAQKQVIPQEQLQQMLAQLGVKP